MSEAVRLAGVVGLRVPGAIAYRHLAIRLVSTACKMAIDSSANQEAPEFEAEVISAFGEAFNNVAVHGYRDVAPEPVQIEVDWDADRLAVTMIDTGKSFDPESVAPPDLDALPEHGMGWFIMTSCMDEIDYQPGPPNVLRLVKRRGPRDGLLPPGSGCVEGGGRGGSRSPSALGVDGRVSGASGLASRDAIDVDGDRGSDVEVIHGAQRDPPVALLDAGARRVRAKEISRRS